MRKFLLSVFCLLTSSVAFAQLSGAYTIGAGGATATNYATFTDAISDMSAGTRGDGGPVNGPAVSGPVTFTVSAGTYNETLTVPDITGSSTTNTITFDGVDPNTRKITSVGAAAYDATITLQFANHFRFRNLEIENTGVTYGYGIKSYFGSDNCEITGCKITLPTASSSTYHVGIILGEYYTSYSLFTATNTLIENNDIRGGRWGIVMNSTTGYVSPGNVVRNNVIRDFYYAGIETNYLSDFTIEGNEIYTNGTYSSAYGMRIERSRNYTVRGNYLHDLGAYGIYNYYGNAGVSTTATIENNMIGGGFTSTGTCYGLYVYNSENTGIYHNSVLGDGGGNSRGIYVSGSSSSGLDIRNNSFACTSTGTSTYAAYIVNASYVATLDYNNYYSDGTYIGYSSGPYATLAAWQLAWPALNPNSREGWPNYSGATDLHTFGAALANWGDNSVSTTVDFDGEARPLAPDVVKDVGADEFVLAPFDMDLMTITSPLVLTIGANTVAVNVMNQGVNSLNGIPVTMQYSTDGGATWPVSETFTPTTLGTTGATEVFSFATPWNVVSPGTYNLCVRINPSVTGDPDATDQLCINVCTGMNGAYTVNPASPTGGFNFNNFVDMAAALSSCGVSGPVTITAQPGTYNEYFEITDIPGASSTNTITIDGVSAAACSIEYAHSSANSYIVKLRGADYVTFQNFTINVTGTSGYGFWFSNQADNNTVDNCIVNLDPMATTVYQIGVVAGNSSYSSYGNNANNLTISNSKIRGGYYGMRINGVSTSTYTDGNRFINNEITDWYYTGIYCRYQSNIEFIGNLIRPRVSPSTSGYGIYCYYAESGFRLESNTIHSCPRYGVYLRYGAYSSGTGTIINNMIGAGWTGTTCYGLYVGNIRNTDIYNNSVSLGPSAGYAAYFTGTMSNIELTNNCFHSTSYSTTNGYALYVSSTSVSGISGTNYNNFYRSSGNLMYFGSIFATFSNYRTAYPLNDVNSVNLDPQFKGFTDLHMVCGPLDGLGTPLASVLVDIDGETRSTTAPDIGADEYTRDTLIYDLGNDTTACGSYIIVSDSAFSSWTWTPSGGGPTKYVDTTGYYGVTVVDTNNCTAFDSVHVTIYGEPVEPWTVDTVSFCIADSLDAGSPGASYIWSTGDTTQMVSAGTPGEYSVTVTTPDGCVVNDTVEVNFYFQPNVNLGADTSFCLGSSHILDAGPGPTGMTYVWNTGASTQVVVATAPGWYVVEVATLDGCTHLDSVYLDAQLPPVVNLGPDISTCDPITLDAGNPGATYNWSTGAGTQTVVVSSTGSYIVDVTNAVGCTSSDTVAVVVNTAPVVDLGPDVTVCVGGTTVLDAGITGMDYAWSTGATTQTITVSGSGLYVCQVTDPSTGCTGIDTISVTQFVSTLNLGADRILCDGASFVLDAGVASAYSWSTGATSSSIVVSSPGTYHVTTTTSGCVDSDTVVVTAGPSVTSDFTAPASAIMLDPVNFIDNTTGATSWYWTFGDGTSSTTASPTHTYLSTGTFEVCLVASNATCSDTTCTNIDITAPVGLEDDILSDGVVIYPNPNNGVFDVRFDLPDTRDLTVQVINLSGQVIYAKELGSVNFHKETISVDGFAKGIYLVKVASVEGGQIIKKVVVQ